MAGTRIYVVTYAPFDPEEAYAAAVASGGLSEGHLMHPSASWEARVAFLSAHDARAYAASRNLELYVDTFASAKLTAKEIRDAEVAATAALAAHTRELPQDAPGAAIVYRHAFVTAAADILQLKLTPEHTLLSVAAAHRGGWRVHAVRGSGVPSPGTVFVVQEEPLGEPTTAYAAHRYSWRLRRWFCTQDAAVRAADEWNVRTYVAARAGNISRSVASRIAELVAARPPPARAAFEAALLRKAVRQLHAAESGGAGARTLEMDLRFAPGGCSVAALALE